MSVARIASRYAKSLIDLSVDQNKLEAIMGDINYFREATKNRDLYLMLKSPIINGTKKQQVLEALFGDKFEELTSAFLRIVVTKGRETLLPEIADEFVNQYKVINHVTTVKLTTASALGAETVSRIKQELTSSSATDAKVELVTAVNPDLVGGFVLEFEDKLYDASVAHKLELLRKEFSN